MNKNEMNTIYLFTDGSVNPQKNIGYGAYLVVLEKEFTSSSVLSEVEVKKFTNTSSTKLELETLLWALKDKKIKNHNLIIYTDCQNIIGLKGRRERFEKNDYNTSKNKKIANWELYQEFYEVMDKTNCKFIKVKGHKKTKYKDEIDKLFTLVDKASRNALRFYIENNNKV